ncbi:hypothetical protein [Vibrio aquimaris]|uniref:Uncharacterized protein n=1 Tax=Vibrio aquimaris TaxID=2587862 RepID=A0A5P9CNM8_9VIBR|nr:hypothetical protein [Vibrio aquimaris]QFT27820.1 hypothetical protein FIV01_15635 [Vibrio aquimaris]
MPLIWVALAAGGVGFGGGFFAGSTASKIIKLAALGGGGYIAYQVIKGSK